MAEAMEPIKKILWMDPLHYALSWDKNNSNGTQGNNNNQKGWEQKSEHAVSAGKLQMWAKGYYQVHNGNNEANQKALVDCQIITYFLFLPLFHFPIFSNLHFGWFLLLLMENQAAALCCLLPT